MVDGIFHIQYESRKQSLQRHILAKLSQNFLNSCTPESLPIYILAMKGMEMKALELHANENLKIFIVIGCILSNHVYKTPYHCNCLG